MSWYCATASFLCCVIRKNMQLYTVGTHIVSRTCMQYFIVGARGRMDGVLEWRSDGVRLDWSAGRVQKCWATFTFYTALIHPSIMGRSYLVHRSKFESKVAGCISAYRAWGKVKSEEHAYSRMSGLLNKYLYLYLLSGVFLVENTLERSSFLFTIVINRRFCMYIVGILQQQTFYSRIYFSKHWVHAAINIDSKGLSKLCTLIKLPLVIYPHLKKYIYVIRNKNHRVSLNNIKHLFL